MFDTVQDPLALAADATVTDAAIIAVVLDGRIELFEALMRRHNQRLFRTLRSILPDDEQAEDVMQDVYLRAFSKLHQFEGRARFSTWLIKIGVYEAFHRLQRQRRVQPLPEEEGPRPLRSSAPDPEEQALQAEMGRLLERCIDRLPQTYRTVFMLRDVEGLATAETAACLELSEEAVKTRLHRARAMLRQKLDRLTAGARAFSFLGERCDRVVVRVLMALFRAREQRL